MVVDSLVLIVSLLVLLYSADLFIDTVIKVARSMGLSTMVVSLTIVAVGTSLPELMASVAAAIKNHTEITVGNIIGSNICNVGLILGVPALFASITCDRAVLRREGYIALFVSVLLTGIAFISAEVSRTWGVVFLASFVAFIVSAFKNGQNAAESIEEAEIEDSMLVIIFKLLIALVLLLISSEFLVRATVSLALDLGASESVIAISLLAFGTSVPELSVAIAAAKRNEGDILVGNIMGSNISNILLVLGTAAVIQPLSFSPAMILLDVPVMTFIAMLMVYFLYKPEGVSRGEGILLLFIYALVIVRCVVFPSS